MGVMVWIDGGGFYRGGGSEGLYEGSEVGKEGKVMVVRMNYGVGGLGFLDVW